MVSMCQSRVPRVIQKTCSVMVSYHSCPTQKFFFLKVLQITARASGPARRDRKEYLLLTARQLAAGILRLHCKVLSCADMFAVEKPNGKQRAIWNGSFISEAAAVPPMPPRLANPSSFLEILVEPGERIYFSKRDASAYFDTLRAPEALQPFFGRPCVDCAGIDELPWVCRKKRSEIMWWIIPIA